MKPGVIKTIAAIVILASFAVAFWVLRGSRQPVAAPDHAGPAATAGRRPAPSETIGPFYVGLSSLDVGENERAGRLYDDLSKRIADEPGVWANLGLARMRLGDLSGADEAFNRAAKLSPSNDQIVLLLSLADENQGRFQQAIDRLRGLSNPNAAVLYRLSELLDRTGAGTDPRQQLEIINRLIKLRPGNIAVQFRRARLLAGEKDASSLADALKELDSFRTHWGPAALQEFDSAKAAVAAGDFREASTHLAFLQNLSLPAPQYQAALSELGGGGGAAGAPIRQFLQYSRPEATVSPADTALTFDVAPDSSVSAPPDLYGAEVLGTNGAASLVSLAGGQVSIGGRAAFSNPTTPEALDRTSLCAADLNGDGLPDLALAGTNGLKLWLQQPNGTFAALAPAENVRSAFETPCHGVWALDYDSDGDLDLMVARDGKAPWILRNNRDGGFTPVDILSSFPEIRDACWADLDGDGNGDLALLDTAGRVLVSWNNRAGAFSPPEVISEQPAVALSFGDILANGRMSLVALGRDGSIQSLTFDPARRAWSRREAARWPDPPDLSAAFAAHRVNVFIADIDNNGAADIVASAGTASVIWLNQGGGQFQRLQAVPPLFVTSVASLDGGGWLSLAGLGATGPATARVRGSKAYHWQSIQTRALANLADGRINSFGVGGRIEIRAGPLLASAPITSPSTHFGLGSQTGVGVVRIIWPNGVAQAEFDPRPDQQVIAMQRLKGSCPWVFARNHDGFHFVKDFIWRSPLGMRINSQDTAGVDQTEDWILIPGKLLTSSNGVYELRITAELWETHFFDYVGLRIADHPDSTSAWVDERFVPTRQPKLEVIGSTPLRPFAEARDQSGRDVSREVAECDGDYLAGFPLGRFQGIAEDHWVEFQIPSDAPLDQKLLLVGQGWVYPTDSSLNVALSQGDNPVPRGLVLEDYDERRGWRTASENLGFPAGKNKTVVIPFPRESLQAGRRRFRLRTNLEVYWDRLGWAVARPDAEIKLAPAEMLSADLRYRGFSKLPPPERRKPDLPRYDQVSGPGPRWQDLEGFYTRYGDVHQLVEQTDDRYVIMNAGDELVLRFAALPPPPPGWTRDFVLVGDGWVKDGDFNTAKSRTVTPLPAHAMRHYGGSDQPLEEDPVFLQHMEDWRVFQTRYVTPTAFDRGLMGPAREEMP